MKISNIINSVTLLLLMSTLAGAQPAPAGLPAMDPVGPKLEVEIPMNAADRVAFKNEWKFKEDSAQWMAELCSQNFKNGNYTRSINDFVLARNIMSHENDYWKESYPYFAGSLVMLGGTNANIGWQEFSNMVTEFSNGVTQRNSQQQPGQIFTGSKRAIGDLKIGLGEVMKVFSDRGDTNTVRRILGIRSTVERLQSLAKYQ